MCFAVSWLNSNQTASFSNLSKNSDEAVAYLLERFVGAQQCAMRTLADMAVIGLDAAVQQRLQHALVRMVTPTVVRDINCLYLIYKLSLLDQS